MGPYSIPVDDSQYTFVDFMTGTAVNGRIPLVHASLQADWVRQTQERIKAEQQEKDRLRRSHPQAYYRVTFLEALQRGARRSKR